MVALASVLIFTALSLLVTHVATVALTLTGLSRQLAQIQARSAFSGVGFTTTEAEQVVNHPVRRRIIMLLMLLGNWGVCRRPHGQSRIYEEDTLLLYGRESGLEELDYRPDTPGGDRAHKQTVAEQESVVHEQNKREAQREQEEQ